MTPAKIPSTCRDAFPVRHRVRHGGMPASREAVLTREGPSLFRRRSGA